MKKQKKLDKPAMIIIFFWVIIGLIGVAIIINYVLHQPSCSITKEECHNESSQISWSITYENISCEYTRTHPSAPSTYKACGDKATFERYCLNYSSCMNSYGEIYTKENYSYIAVVHTPIYTQKEVCEQKEVDEVTIAYPEKVVVMDIMENSSIASASIINPYNKVPIKCQNINKTQIICKQNKIEYVSKNDITNEWLQHNCVCIKQKEYYGSGVIKPEMPCITYKCNQYTVEIK